MLYLSIISTESIADFVCHWFLYVTVFFGFGVRADDFSVFLNK